MSALERRLTIGVLAFFVGLGLLFSFNQPGGPTSETTGVVESSGFAVWGDTKAPAQVVTLRLAGGSTVQADVPPNVVVVPGQRARVRVYRRVITGTESYEVFAVEGK